MSRPPGRSRLATPGALTLALGLVIQPVGCSGDDTGASETNIINPTESGDSAPGGTLSGTKGTTTTGDPTGDPTGGETTTTTGGEQPLSGVDILFVIDDSGTMAQAQALLSAGIPALIDALEAAGDPIDYRIGFTTTDMGNPRCSQAKTPAKGSLLLSSCVDRIDDDHFVFYGANPPRDVSAICSDFCGLTDAALTVTPTAVAGDQTMKPRPWIERIRGQSNLPPGISTVDAFRCFAPQGIAGCGFEAPMEGLYQALRRAESPAEDNFGFIRDDALLAVVIVSDEADCSSNPDWADVWTGATDESRTLWNQPDDFGPTSAVCWRAGTRCQGGSCVPENVSIIGKPGVGDNEAVLYPLRRYTELLAEYEDKKRAVSADAEILVTVIAGVPQGYDGDAPPIPYTATGAPPSSDQFLDDFGIDPGCVTSAGFTTQAVPPVRLRELAASFPGGAANNLFSVCDPDYAPALASLGAAIRSKL